MFKIAIIYKITKNIWGGGNSFLKNLKYNLYKKKLYTDRLQDANIILFNGHQYLFSVLFSRLRYPKKVFIHRFDGPMQDARLIGSYLDNFLYYYNNIIADGTIFQSDFSRKKNINYGYKSNNINTVIHNFVSSEIFNTINKKKNSLKIRVCCSSFSKNKNKGLDDLNILDERVDFNKIELFYIGNIANAKKFNNIILIPLKNHKEYAEILKTSQYFLTLSYFECCSNSVLEAICTGNKIIYRKNSGINEIAQSDSIEFTDINNLIHELNTLVDIHPTKYKNDAKLSNEKGTLNYLNFFSEALKVKKKFKYYKLFFYIKLIFLYYRYKIMNYYEKTKS